MWGRLTSFWGPREPRWRLAAEALGKEPRTKESPWSTEGTSLSPAPGVEKGNPLFGGAGLLLVQEVSVVLAWLSQS